MSVKRKDEQNRWRNKVISFRMSPEEADMLDKMAEISGYSKQDYIISKLLEHEVVVEANPRVFKKLRNHLEDILQELKKNPSPTVDTLTVISHIVKILENLKGGDKK